MKFCKECGHKIKNDVEFCSECGTSVFNTTSQNNTNRPTQLNTQTRPLIKQLENPIKKMTRKQKIIISIVAGIAVLFFFFFQIGSNVTSKETAIKNLESAIIEKDNELLANLIVSSDPRITVDEESVKSFLRFIDENPSYLSELMEEIDRQSRMLDVKNKSKNVKTASLEIYDLLDDENGALLTLKKFGKTALLFNKYRFEIKPFFISIRTNYEGANIYLNDEEIATSDSREYYKEFGPLFPGIYNVRSEYTGEYATISAEQEINSFIYDGNIDVSLWLEAMHVSADSNYDDAKVFVNGKDVGLTVNEFNDFGPVNPGVSIQAVKSFPWGEVKSKEFSIESGKYNYKLDLVPNNSAFFGSIIEIIKEYQKSRSDSIIALDGTKLLHASESLNRDLNDDINRWKEKGYKYYGNLTDIILDLDYSDIKYDDESNTYNTKVRYISNFMGAWLVGDVTEEEINKAKNTNKKSYNYIDIAYNLKTKKWIIEEHSERSWSFNIDNGKEISY
jgi:uncharacterized membrane protein YvbJ